MTLRHHKTCSALLLGALLVASGAAGCGGSSKQPVPPVTHTVTLDKYSVLIDGKRIFLWAGEFHYWRLPSPDQWRDVLEKLKAAGYNAANIYFHWGYHSPAPGVYDFTGIRDVEKLLDVAAEVGIYVIARPGPYINAETDGGGYPAWLDRLPGAKRSPDPDFVRYSDEWLSQILPIMARHQLTNGTGTIILAQVENEFSDNSSAGRTYMQHLMDKFRADGITVPLTGNHWNSFNAGNEGKLDVDGWDPYPQGFDCSHPTVWRPVPDFTWLHDELAPYDRPLFFPEYQGGAFDPWGGPGYEACRTLTGPDFQKVFYSTNIAVGSTMHSFYMTYGGTSWGYLPFPGVYTSYDYGSAISESRQLTAKYDQQKLYGYLLAAVPSLTKTDLLSAPAVTNSAIWARARMNPDDKTQLYVLRHQDSTSTRVDQTHLSIDLSGRTGFSYDDPSSDLVYSAGWTHAAGESWSVDDYLGTETYCNTPGSTVSFAFHGPAVRWISSLYANHGIAKISIDGTEVATVDTYGADKQYQYVAYQAYDLADADHTLTITVTGRKNASASDSYVVVDAVDVPPVASGEFYASVPQEPSTAITLDGRDAKLLLANLAFGAGQRLVYSTSELLTTGTLDRKDFAVLHGKAGEAGETVLRYASQPTVMVLSGAVSSTWDGARGDLRLNYTHGGLAKVRVTSGSSPDLVLLLADEGVAAQLWRLDTAAGPVLARGPYLVRSAAAAGATLALRGDTTRDTTLELFAPAALSTVTWNGTSLAITGTTGLLAGPGTASLPGPAPVALPDLTWRYRYETPEKDPAFDDYGWTLASHATSLSAEANGGNTPLLAGDEYGFHYGHTWYRGRFKAYGTETSLTLDASTGGARVGQYAAWLNGVYLGSGDGGRTFSLESLTAGQEYVVSVLVNNVGHDEGTSKVQRGLTSARLNGSSATIAWRVQGNLGGETLVDVARGPLNNGGLFGERAGWHLPGFPDDGWTPVTLPYADGQPGVAWYRSSFTLDLPQGHDVPLALRFADDASRHYRAQIFLNGWNMGLFVNDVGPQHDFVLPAGLLRTNGTNTLALAVWSSDATTGGLGTVSLAALGNARGGVTVGEVMAPGFDAATYAQPVPPAHLTLSGPDLTIRGGTAAVTATLTVPSDRPAVSSATVMLALPAGWVAAENVTASLGAIDPGQSATATWTVTAPAGDQPTVALLLAQAALTVQGEFRSLEAGRIMSVPAPPPSGSVYVSDLPFSSTNGWGPVERDMSNGEAAAGDGRTLTIGSTTYSKGLGAHSPSDVTVYVGGSCTRFTSIVGVDAESWGMAGFHVLADGQELASSGNVSGSTAVSLDVDITGAQWLDLVADDGGDGNGGDHADWADAMLQCN